MTAEEHDALTCMRNHGGGFISALAEAFFLADEDNFNKLKSTFSELLAEYIKHAAELSKTRWPSALKDQTQ